MRLGRGLRGSGSVLAFAFEPVIYLVPAPLLPLRLSGREKRENGTGDVMLTACVGSTCRREHSRTTGWGRRNPGHAGNERDHSSLPLCPWT